MLFYPRLICNRIRKLSQGIKTSTVSFVQNCPNYLHLNNDLTNKPEIANDLIKTMSVYENFLTQNEETSILDEIEPYMKRLKYEFDHWDDAIHGYRETERLQWNQSNTEILNRVREIAFPPETAQLKYVHILDLDQKGYIKPHIDSVRFCGCTIAGLSLLTDSVMRLVHDKHKNLYADVLLKRRSLYIMRNSARYDYTHEILENQLSKFKGKEIIKNRRISVICRNEPDNKKNDS